MPRKTTRIARRFVVRGIVQGVGFRWFTAQAANLLGVRGWVRNLDDGSVEVYAVADPDTLDDFAGRLHQGPRFSEVRGVEASEAPLLQSSGFSIRH